MKELSIEEKAKAYDEAIKIARDYHKRLLDDDNPEWASEIEKIFPELKESEGERIEKQLLNWFKGCHWDSIDDGRLKRDDIIAWLEKQDKEVDVIENFDTEFEKQVSRLLASIINKDWEYTEGFVKWASNSLLGYAKHEIEKQGEQKPAWSEEDEKMMEAALQFAHEYGRHRLWCWLKSLRPQSTWKPQDKSALEEIDEKPTDNADKIEPKFKVGDWVVIKDGDDFSNGIKAAQITNIDDDERCWFDIFGTWLEKGDIRHWTIKDAMDGDVLQLGEVTAIFKESIGNEHCRCYCSIWNGEFEIPSQDGVDNNYGCCNAALATKEQWNALQSKMEEVGYKWDSKNKKLINKYLTIYSKIKDKMNNLQTPVQVLNLADDDKSFLNAINNLLEK